MGRNDITSIPAFPAREIAQAAVEAGGMILAADGARDKHVTAKEGTANFVTEYDLKIQNFLEERLSALLPGATFLAEEGGEDREKPSSGFTFVIDPIDGTANFIRGLRNSSVSVGLLYAGEPVFGCVALPYAGETFTAEKGRGAFVNGKRISVSERRLRDSIVLFGTSPYYREELGEATVGALERIFMNSQDVRRLGSAAQDLVLAACGRADAFFELRLSPWDIAAGALIFKEAGGVITDANGNPLPFDRKTSVLCGNRINHPEIIKLLRGGRN